MKASEAAGDRVYFPELDGIRFVAFALVFLYHEGIPWALLNHAIGADASRCFHENGWVGVYLFFILSGYLITTLLLREERSFGRIDLRAFWVRRILRIWPLYYLTVALAFGVLPWLDGAFQIPEERATIVRHLPGFLTFLGNWSMIFLGPVRSDTQSVLWSVCVEEQFYLAAPLIVALFAPRLRVPVVVVSMLASIALRAHLAQNGAGLFWFAYGTFSQADTLLSGVLLALLLGADPRGSKAGPWLRWLQWPLLGTTVWLFSRSNLAHTGVADRTWGLVAIWAVSCGLIATAVTVPGGLRRVLGYSRLVWLGKISYGLYMFHEVAFWLNARFAGRLGWFPNKEILVPIAGFALTVGLAAASYYLYERPFLRRKRHWTRVPSRPL